MDKTEYKEKTKQAKREVARAKRLTTTSSLNGPGEGTEETKSAIKASV